MPIYEYHCRDCEEPFEVFVRTVSAPPTALCPKCGSEHIEKQVTAASALGGGAGAYSDASCAPSG